MTVTVTLQDGATDKYMRFGDEYVKHNDGTLDVIRDGAKRPYHYAPGAWTDVKGNEKRWTDVKGNEKRLKRSHFWG
jgi:hypothetical protein